MKKKEKQLALLRARISALDVSERDDFYVGLFAAQIYGLYKSFELERGETSEILYKIAEFFHECTWASYSCEEDFDNEFHSEFDDCLYKTNNILGGKINV